jgi:hypothetical protein
VKFCFYIFHLVYHKKSSALVVTGGFLDLSDALTLFANLSNDNISMLSCSFKDAESLLTSIHGSERCYFLFG